MEAGRHLSLDQLVAGDALTLINSDIERALLFYAECWALVHFLTMTQQEEYRAAFQKYRDAIDAGSSCSLTDCFPDLKALEADFVKFVRRL